MVFTLEEISLKLDIYNNNICDNLFNCAKDDKYCKSMISKLVFYDRDQILQMHADSLMNRDFKYDVSTLQVVPFLGKNEKVAKIVPLEGHWIAVFFLDKNKNILKVYENVPKSRILVCRNAYYTYETPVSVTNI